MSKYTEAHFAATLLECGPHVTACLNCIDNDRTCPLIAGYRIRVQTYFSESVPDAPTPRPYGEYAVEWNVFWSEYQTWVGI